MLAKPSTKPRLLRFQEGEWTAMQSIPNIENLYWHTPPNYNGAMGGSDTPTIQLRTLSSNQLVFSMVYQAFPVCCGAFTIASINSTLPTKEGLKVIEGLLATAGGRLHLYIEAAGRPTPLVQGMLNKFGRVITSFGNTYHQNHELRLWAISSDTSKILDSFTKGTFQ